MSDYLNRRINSSLKLSWRNEWLPTPIFHLDNAMNRGAWQATVHGVSKADTTEYGCKHSVQFSHSVVSDSLQPQGLQHARPPSPSPTPIVQSNSCPLSW